MLNGGLVRASAPGSTNPTEQLATNKLPHPHWGICYSLKGLSVWALGLICLHRLSGIFWWLPAELTIICPLSRRVLQPISVEASIWRGSHAKHSICIHKYEIERHAIYLTAPRTTTQRALAHIILYHSYTQLSETNHKHVDNPICAIYYMSSTEQKKCSKTKTYL